MLFAAAAARRTARIWSRAGQCMAVLQGHAQAVWAVLAVDEDTLATASADRTVRLWSTSAPHPCIRVVTAHTDCVRGLCNVLDLGFASCSNDTTVAVFDRRGDRKLQLRGHASFVYRCVASCIVRRSHPVRRST